MSQVISWIAAVAESGEAPNPGGFRDTESDVEPANGPNAEQTPDECSPAHQPSSIESEENNPTQVLDDPLDRNPDLRMYRGRTSAMLRLYLRYSLETGRLPSLMGSEYFRTRVTCYTVVTFEDRVIFVHDMETCLQKLNEFSRQIILRCILQGHNLWDAARLLQCNEKTIRRYFSVAIDELSEILLEVGLMEKLDSNSKKSCQGGKSDQFPVSDCDESENNF